MKDICKGLNTTYPCYYMTIERHFFIGISYYNILYKTTYLGIKDKGEVEGSNIRGIGTRT